jgi:hypothetical protein
LESFFEELLYLGAHGGVILGEVGEGLKGEGFYDGAAIFEVVVECGCGALAFGGSETEAWDHGGQMPAEFDLFGFGEEAEEFGFVAVEETRLLGGDFFGGVGGSAADDGVFVPEAFDELAEVARLFEDEASYFVGAADGAPVAAVEEACHRRFRHLIDPLDAGGLFREAQIT